MGGSSTADKADSAAEKSDDGYYQSLRLIEQSTEQRNATQFPQGHV